MLNLLVPRTRQRNIAENKFGPPLARPYSSTIFPITTLTQWTYVICYNNINYSLVVGLMATIQLIVGSYHLVAQHELTRIVKMKVTGWNHHLECENLRLPRHWECTAAPSGCQPCLLDHVQFQKGSCHPRDEETHSNLSTDTSFIKRAMWEYRCMFFDLHLVNRQSAHSAHWLDLLCMCPFL